MNIVIASIKKEFKQLMRNKLLVAIICASPIIILGILPFSVENHTKINIGIVDQDQSSTSRMISYRMHASPYFVNITKDSTLEKALDRIKKNKNDIAFVIPRNLEKESTKDPFFIALDGTHILNAQSQLAFFEEMLQYNSEKFHKNNQVSIHYMFNSEMNGRPYFIVSLLILVVTLVSVCLITINLVSEKEDGTWGQLQATPLSIPCYVVAKFVFFILIGLSEMIIGLILCYIFYSFQVACPLSEYILLTLIFLFPILMIGLFIASIANTQVQAVYLMVFVLLTLILMSTMFSFFNAMPSWAKMIRFINPLYYMLESSRLMLLKSFSIFDATFQASMLFIQGIILAFVTFILMSRSRFFNANR